jgi:hypothetical protein
MCHWERGRWWRSVAEAEQHRIIERQQSTQELYRQQPWLYRQRYGYGDATPQQRALQEQLDAEAVQLDAERITEERIAEERHLHRMNEDIRRRNDDYY